MLLFAELEGFIPRISVLLLFTVISYFVTRGLFRIYIKFAHRKGWVGKDIHKKERPEVAESGGVPFLIGIAPAAAVVPFFFPELTSEFIVFMITVYTAGIIGFIDDRITLSTFGKIFLMLITGVPVTAAHILGYIHLRSPLIPILGQTQLTIIYPLSIPIIYAVLTNAVNMMEGYNGEGTGTILIAMAALIVCALLSSSAEGLVFSLVMIGGLAAFFGFNKYPARVFPGDVGTLALGAAVAGIAVFGSLEVAMFCAILGHVFNGFYILASLKGFRERHRIKTRDIIMDENDIIHPSGGIGDHLTLPRLIVATRPMGEKELVHNFWALSGICASFAVISEVVRRWTVGVYDPPLHISILIICASVYVILNVKFPAIRGISYFMIVLLIGGVGFLMLIDTFVVGWTLNWLIAGILAAIGFVIWYIATIKYFWYKMSKSLNRKYRVTVYDIAVNTLPFLEKYLSRIFRGKKKGESSVSSEKTS